MESLIKNRPFIDGNKRSAITSSAIFLQVNGHNLKASQEELERFTLKMAVKKSLLKLRQNGLENILKNEGE